MTDRKKENLNLLSVCRSKGSYVTKKEFSRQQCTSPVCPQLPPKKKRQPIGRSLHVYGNAEAVYFKKEVKLSALYRRDIDVTYLDQIFENLIKIGEGSFGVVYKATSKDDRRDYALKAFKRKHLTLVNSYKEVQSSEKIGDNEYCVGFVRAWEEQKVLYMQMQYCITSLAKYALASNSFTECQLWNILTDVLLGLKHLHDKNFIHLDIKPENIMISQNGVCKLGDFGLLVDLEELNKAEKANNHVLNLSEGDAKYLAAEVLQQKLYTKSCDIFSVGITILELATDLVLPANGSLWHQLRELTFPEVFYENVPVELQVLIQKMMNFKHEKRPQVNRILNHSIIRGILKERRELPRPNHLPFNNNTEQAPNYGPTINVDPATPPATEKNFSFHCLTPLLDKSDNNLPLDFGAATPLLVRSDVAKKLFTC